jgi:glycosyltransferase involved in cell wall biosynthesis
LHSLFDQNFPQAQYEIIVVVDGSVDGTIEMVMSLKAPCTFKVRQQPNRGQAAARNLGWKAAAGDLILFLDDDMLCDRSLVEHHIAAHSASKPVVIIGLTLLAAESPPSILTPGLYNFQGQTKTKPAFPIDIMVCSNTSLRRSLLELADGFDERFRWFEDMDLGVRLQTLGVPFQFEPRAVARHLFVKSPETSVKNQYWCGRNSVLLGRTHPSLRPFTLLTPLENGSYLVFHARQLAVKLASISLPFTEWLFAFANSVRSISLFHRVATYLHGVQCRIQFFRGAIEEAGSVEAYRTEFGTMLPILRYDLGESSKGTTGKRASLGKLPAHLEWLVKRGFTGITLADWRLWRVKAMPLPVRPLVLAFEGISRVLGECILPLLQTHGFRAALLVNANRLELVSSMTTSECCAAGVMDIGQIRSWADKGFEFVLMEVDTDTHSATDALLLNALSKRRALAESLLGCRVSKFAYQAAPSSDRLQKCVGKRFDFGIGTQRGINELRTAPAALKTLSVRTNDSVFSIHYKLWRIFR